MNHSTPYFSIIIPTLNEEKFLPQLLEDLSRQTFKDFEVLVIDGNSEDQTVSLAKSFSSSLPQVTTITTKTRNVSHQRNLGANKARGLYLIFNDADNSLPDYFLQGIHYQITKTKPDLFTCYCQPDSNNPSDKLIARLANLTIEATFLLDNPGALGALIGCKKSVFSKTQGFNQSIGFAEDKEFFQRASKLKLKTQLFHDPKFTYSLRRVRANGTLKAARSYAKLFTKSILQTDIDQPIEYPMGGNVHSRDHKSNRQLNKIQQTLATAFKKPGLRKRLTTIFQTLHDEGSF